MNEQQRYELFRLAERYVNKDYELALVEFVESLIKQAEDNVKVNLVNSLDFFIEQEKLRHSLKK